MDFDYLKQKRILLVDDEQELLDMVVSYLKRGRISKYQNGKNSGVKRFNCF